jgi:coenzyme F420-reducing hydrogenase alpha subunit
MSIFKQIHAEVKETEQINEGIMSYTVNGSDTAADLYGKCIDALVPVLRKGLKEKGNEYNTTGYENVAMVLLEKFKQDIKYSKLAPLAREVGKKCLDEAAAMEAKTNNFEDSKEKKVWKSDMARLKKWGNELLKVAVE